MAVDWKKMGMSFALFVVFAAALKAGKKVVGSASPKAGEFVNKVL